MAEGWKEVGGYGPSRRGKKDADTDMEGPYGSGLDTSITIQPVEIEMEVADEPSEPYEKPSFKPLPASAVQMKKEIRRIATPAHRITPLKNAWAELLDPLVQHLKLQVRMNTKRKCVEIRASEHTPDISYLQKGADFVKAFMLGFDIKDAVALLRLDDLFIESFEVKDVKRLNGDHLARAIGRLAGKDGKTKYAVENATRTRIVLADDKIHILGSFGNMKLARNAVCSLIMGSPPSKVYSHLRTVSKRIMEHV